MKRFFTLAALVIAFSATSCQKWLDINTNPNYLADAAVSQLLPTVQLRTADKVGYELALYGHFWAQYVNQNKNTNQYYTVMTYDETTSSFTSPWSYFYSGVLPGIKEIISKCTADGATNMQNYLFEARVMEAYTFYLLTSLYDDVAYTEGYLTENQTPKFDSGKDMQAIIIGLLEDIRKGGVSDAEASEAVNSSAGSDMIFGGDIASWMQFANTLYLKVLMRDFNANKAKIQSLLAENNFLEADAAFDNFEDKADKSNPLYESDRRQLNTTANIRCCSDILNVLDAEDPRLEYDYDEIGAVGDKFGVTTDPDHSGRLALSATDPVYFSTVDEVNFLKAEAYARLGDAKAKDCYEAGIQACFDRTGCPDADKFIEIYAFDPSASAEAQVEQIINQKWASNVRAMAWESWFDINRTGYPERGKTINASNGVLSQGQFAVRFLVSNTSVTYNPNSPEVKPIYEKMWWHK